MAKRLHTMHAFGSIVLFIAETVVVISGQPFFPKSRKYQKNKKKTKTIHGDEMKEEKKEKLLFMDREANRSSEILATTIDLSHY